MSAVMVLVGVIVAALVGWRVAAHAKLEAPAAVGSLIVDMLLVGLVAARIAFVLTWFSDYKADPWSILRIGDGGFSPVTGVLAGLLYGAWRVRGRKPLRWPLAIGAVAGLVSWVAVAGALTLLQQSTLKLPDAQLAQLGGETTSLQEMAGKPMVVNLWATWCPPCVREMPVLAQAQVQREDVNFAFVNQGEDAPRVQAFLQRAKLQLHNVLLDPFSSVLREAGSGGLPTTLFFDADGQLVDVHMGELTQASLARKLQRFGPR